MARIITMFKKAESPILEDLRRIDKKRVERVIANYDRKVKEALKDQNNKTATNQ